MFPILHIWSSAHLRAVGSVPTSSELEEGPTDAFPRWPSATGRRWPARSTHSVTVNAELYSQKGGLRQCQNSVFGLWNSPESGRASTTTATTMCEAKVREFCSVTFPCDLIHQNKNASRRTGERKFEAEDAEKKILFIFCYTCPNRRRIALWHIYTRSELMLVYHARAFADVKGGVWNPEGKATVPIHDFIGYGKWMVNSALENFFLTHSKE